MLELIGAIIGLIIFIAGVIEGFRLVFQFFWPNDRAARIASAKALRARYVEPRER